MLCKMLSARTVTFAHAHVRAQVQLMAASSRWAAILSELARAVMGARACYFFRMRTTVELDAEAARAIERLRRERGLGVSQAVNELVHRGLLPRRTEGRFRQRTARLGLRVDVSNIAETLDALEGPTSR